MSEQTFPTVETITKQSTLSEIVDKVFKDNTRISELYADTNLPYTDARDMVAGFYYDEVVKITGNDVDSVELSKIIEERMAS